MVQFNSDGEGLEKQITDFEPRLIIFDNKIGLTTADELLKELRQSELQIPPFILFSAIEKIADRAQDLGAVNFISKPVKKEVLLTTIASSIL